MANTKISALPSLTGALLASNDEFPVVDISATATKQITTAELKLGLFEAAALTGATTILANSASAALTVTQTGAGNAFVVEDSASVDSTPFVIDGAGNVGIGEVGAAGRKFHIGGTYSGATTTRSANFMGTVDPAVSTVAHHGTVFAPSVSAGTLPTLIGFYGVQGTFTGAVTSQMSFYSESTVTGATNNYGFFSNIASAANRFNFYAAGSAPNYFSGQTTLTDPALTPLVINSNGATDATRGIQFDVGSVNFGRITVPAGSGGALALWSGAGGAAAEKLRLPAATLGAVVGNATAIPAGGTAGFGFCGTSTANFGMFFGSGAPTLSAAQGSLYLRSDGSSTSTRMYVNTNGTTGWTNVTTAA